MKRALFLAAALAACDSSPADRTSSPSLALTGQETCSTQGVEYRHTLERSRGPVPKDTKVTHDGQMDKYVGGKAVFAIWLSDGSALLSSNAGPQPAQTMTGDAHKALVRSYFEEAGVRGCEIHGTSTSWYSGGGYTASLVRSIDGIVVAESLAWARLDDEGGSSEESVFWPAIDPATVEQAQKLRATLADPARAADFFGRLPAGTPTDGEVLIHHTPAHNSGPLKSWVSYDVHGKCQLSYSPEGAELARICPK